MTGGKIRVVSIVGTRPEVVKMAPVVRALDARPDVFHHSVVSTGQHREMLMQILDVFGIVPEIDLALMAPNQRLSDLTSRTLASVSDLFERVEPDVVLVQGDTTTVMCAALAAFYLGIDVGHVEAGLRSRDMRNPFPEELNRRVAGLAATLHFAPTARACADLEREGVDPSRIFRTGNTVVDALQMLPLDVPFEERALDDVRFDDRRVMLVTTHRRESHGAPLRRTCSAIQELVSSYDDLEVVLPVHLNPNVRGVVQEMLDDIPRVHLVSPLGYVDLLKVLSRSHLVLTDSGGIQEEAPSFGKPVVVLRERTERPELIEAGLGWLVGTDPVAIVERASALLDNEELYANVAAAENPFGDGRAAPRIADILAQSFGRQPLGDVAGSAVVSG